jgi:hypothetical protein
MSCKLHVMWTLCVLTNVHNLRHVRIARTKATCTLLHR